MGSGYSMAALPQWYYEGSRTYGRKGYNAAMATWRAGELDADISSKTFVVTGANAGLGRAVATHLATRRATVHMVCRNEARGRAAHEEIAKATGNSNLTLHLVDMSDFDAVKRWGEDFASTNRVDCLINNAGAMPPERHENAVGCETGMAAMMGGTFLLTGLLVPALRRSTSPRVVDVSSGGMYLAQLDTKDLQCTSRKYDPAFQYAVTKRAQVILSESWAQQLKGFGVNVYCMHPGWADTEGVKKALPDFREQRKGDLRTAAEGADTIMWLATNPALNGPSGEFWFDRKPVRKHMRLARTRSSDEDKAWLWGECERLTGWRWSPPTALGSQGPAAGSGEPTPAHTRL